MPDLLLHQFMSLHPNKIQNILMGTETPDKQPLKPCHSFEEWKNNQESKWSKMPYVALAHSKDAWHARDAQVAELEAALKIAREALEKLNGFGPSDLSESNLFAYVNETCTEALSLIQKTLSRDLPN